MDVYLFYGQAKNSNKKLAWIPVLVLKFKKGHLRKHGTF